jgi:hypothetical protein
MTPGPPDDRDGGPPAHVELPEAVPDRIRERILSGRSVQRAGQTSEFGI